MFTGTHLLLFSRNAEADRDFFRDVLEMTAVDSGEGWLIFRMPPAEMGIHPAASQPPPGEDSIAAVSLYLLCRDLARTMETLAQKGVTCGAVHQAEWGIVTSIPLPGGSRIGLYEPHHALAIQAEG